MDARNGVAALWPCRSSYLESGETICGDSSISGQGASLSALPRYNLALDDQPKLPALHYGEFKLLAAILFVAGSTMVLSSMWKLGLFGTYLGMCFCLDAVTVSDILQAITSGY